MTVAGADGERAQVYAAEIAAFDGTDLETVRPLDVVVAMIDALLADAWWPGPAVHARPARSDARSSSTRSRICTAPGVGARSSLPLSSGAGSPTVEIRIAGPQATVATAAHELAHALAGVEHGHGEVFRRAHLDVVAVITNLSGQLARRQVHVEQLRSAYAVAGLEIGPRAWPAPPDVGGAIAL